MPLVSLTEILPVSDHCKANPAFYLFPKPVNPAVIISQREEPIGISGHIAVELHLFACLGHVFYLFIQTEFFRQAQRPLIREPLAQDKAVFFRLLRQ